MARSISSDTISGRPLSEMLLIEENKFENCEDTDRRRCKELPGRCQHDQWGSHSWPLPPSIEYVPSRTR